MQLPNARGLPPHEVCLPLSQLHAHASKPGTTYPSKVETSPDVTIRQRWQSRPSVRRRRRKRSWRAACTYLLPCALCLARRGAAVTTHEGEHDGICCQIS